MPPSPPGRSRTNDPYGKVETPMKLGTLVIIGSAVSAVAGCAIGAPFPALGENHWNTGRWRTERRGRRVCRNLRRRCTFPRRYYCGARVESPAE